MSDKLHKIAFAMMTVMLLAAAGIVAVIFFVGNEAKTSGNNLGTAEVIGSSDGTGALNIEGMSVETEEQQNAGNAETSPTYGICTTSPEKTEHDYSYLRGTAYKNLIETKYKNLLESGVKKEEIVAETEKPSGGQPKPGVGAATNPGFSGSVGSYSLESKTIAAHLSVQGTNVQNRPIWQCTGNTNYYTKGSVTWAAGSANLRSGPLSQNTVIYGHNWNNCFVPFKRGGGEFESLMSFVYEDFVAQNQYIYLTTNSGVHTFKVFAVCFTTDLGFYINCNGINVASVAQRAKNMSLFDFGVDVGGNDKIITLSTCTRYFKGMGANQRFIIMGKLVSGE